MNIKRDAATILSMATPILQGLLASGHYTTNDTEFAMPEIIKRDSKEEYEEKICARKFISVAVEDAISLACEMIDQINIDFS